MTDDELTKLASIITALQDIHDSVKAGRRNREFAIFDLEEEIEALADFTKKLPA